MEIIAWAYILVGVTFSIYIGFAIWSKAASTSEFYVAGKGVPAFANGMDIGTFGMYNVAITVNGASYDNLPVWVKNWQETGFIQYEDKNQDGILQNHKNADQNELTIDKDIMVLANPEIARLPN